jgi:hypothetical protein
LFEDQAGDELGFGRRVLDTAWLAPKELCKL